ncbi:hypothetical protein D5S17_01605 [Pseudonocardiaceae bacterium YIM PH 21723]|nr:hypothetical protein D5S17_01605 [Pseudonocardiaceae bacterium YIM PH 21723]
MTNTPVGDSSDDGRDDIHLWFRDHLAVVPEERSPRLVPNRPAGQDELLADVVEDNGRPNRLKRYLLAKCVPALAAAVPGTIVACVALAAGQSAMTASGMWAGITTTVAAMINPPRWRRGGRA